MRNTDLDARNFFAVTRAPFKLNQFGGTVGGPIRKNKTFFFFNLEQYRDRELLYDGVDFADLGLIVVDNNG